MLPAMLLQSVIAVPSHQLLFMGEVIAGVVGNVGKDRANVFRAVSALEGNPQSIDDLDQMPVIVIDHGVTDPERAVPGDGILRAQRINGWFS